MPKSIEEKKAELQAQIKQLEEKGKAQQSKKNAITGRIINEAIENDDTLKYQINALLEANLKKNNERQLFGLEKLPSKNTEPQQTTEPQNSSLLNKLGVG